jgi:hypothetical protein
MLIPFSIRNIIMLKMKFLLKMKFYVDKKHCDIFETQSFKKETKTKTNLVIGPKGFKY